MTAEEWLNLKKQVETLGRQADRAQGSLDQALEALRSEFGCETLEEAREELRAMTEGRAEEERALDRDWRAWRDRWENLLEGKS